MWLEVHKDCLAFAEIWATVPLQNVPYTDETGQVAYTEVFSLEIQQEIFNLVETLCNNLVVLTCAQAEEVFCGEKKKQSMYACADCWAQHEDALKARGCNTDEATAKTFCNGNATVGDVH